MARPTAWFSLFGAGPDHWFVSGALWVAQMFLLSLGLAWLRRRSDSVMPAIAAHAAFNAAMNHWIFTRLWA